MNREFKSHRPDHFPHFPPGSLSVLLRLACADLLGIAEGGLVEGAAVTGHARVVRVRDAQAPPRARLVRVPLVDGTSIHGRLIVRVRPKVASTPV